MDVDLIRVEIVIATKLALDVIAQPWIRQPGPAKSRHELREQRAPLQRGENSPDIRVAERMRDNDHWLGNRLASDQFSISGCVKTHRNQFVLKTLLGPCRAIGVFPL